MELLLQAVCRVGQYLYKIVKASAYDIVRLLFNLLIRFFFFLSVVLVQVLASSDIYLKEPDVVGMSLLGTCFKVYSGNIDHFFSFFFLNSLLHILLPLYVIEHTGELILLHFNHLI